jgi:hypothetical protein
MPAVVYRCELCNGLFGSLVEASSCEEDHAKFSLVRDNIDKDHPLSNFAVKSCGYSNGGIIPKTILIVNIKDDSDIFAAYYLDESDPEEEER